MRIEHRVISKAESQIIFDQDFVVARTYTWAWLVNVARRRNDLWVRYGAGTHWEYAPAHVAVTQEYS